MRPSPSQLNEFELIARHFAPLARFSPGAYELLDDAAVIGASSGHELVATTDAIVAGVDFPPDAVPELIARKALRVNLSDLAAKGARPRAYLLDLVLPREIDEAWIAAFAAGLAADQNEYGVALIGGDMSSTSGPVVIVVSAFGEAPTGRIIRRGGARVGDLIFVTGTIGDAALGLRVLQGALPALDETSAAFLLQRYRLPQPRAALGPELIGIATAGIDVSDGLIADLGHLCSVSGLDATVTAPSVPLSPAARTAINREAEGLAVALTGGDDYELLFTAPQPTMDRLRALSQSTGIPITPIGEMTGPLDSNAPRVLVLDEQRRPLDLGSRGWTHWRSGRDSNPPHV